MKEIKVRTNVPKLNVRQGPGANYPVSGTVNGTYTIIEQENGFGLLKSRAGWIDLSLTTPVYERKEVH